MADQTTEAPKSMLVPLAAFAAGAALAVLLGVFGRVHDPTLDGTTTLGFHTVIQMKVVVTTLIAVLVLGQLLGALVLYGKLPVTAPPWLGTAHRVSGVTTVVHGLLGCTVFGAAAVKVAAVRAKRAPGWFLPLAGGLLFTVFVLVI